MCPATLLNSFISSSSFLVDSLRFSVYSIMSSANKEFYFFLSNLDAFYFFYLSDCCARTVSGMLNKRGESRHFCLVPNLKGNSYSFCPWSMIIAVGLSYMAFIMFRYVPSSLTLLRVFIINGCWSFLMFFCTYWHDHVVFILHFVHVVNDIYWFENVVPTLHSWINST